MVLGINQSWLETSQVWNGEWDESWDSAWYEGQENWDESWSWPAIEDGTVDGNAGGTAPGVQSLVLSPVISEMFSNVFTGLVFATDSPSEYSDESTHFSTDETVCNVSISGLQCLEQHRLFCTCGNCMIISEEFGASLGRCQVRQFKLNMFFNTLPTPCQLLEPEFFEETETVFVFDTESACSCVFDQPANSESEFGEGSDEDLGSTACQLWNLDIGWVHDDTHQVDSSLLCSMFSSDCRDSSGTHSGTTARTVPGPLQRSACFDCGLQGIEVSGSQDVSSDLISRNCHRIHLQKFGVSTFLNVQETVSHACQLHKFSPVVHPLLSEIMMGNESQHWWLLDSGAAATVMATASRATYGAWVTGAQNARFRAANGSKVSIDGSASVSVWVGFKKRNDNLGRTPIYRQAKLKCLVGGISHNIMSTNTLCECGWEFNQNPEGTEVTHCESGLRLADICNFGGCPWVKLDPAWMYNGSDTPTYQGNFVMSDGMNAVHENAQLNPLSRAAEAALEAHRMQGHVPYDPRCIIVHEGNRPFSIVVAEKALLKQKFKLILGF